MDSYLKLATGFIGIVLGSLWLKFEWEKYKSGTPYGVTNHFKAVLVFIIFSAILINGLIDMIKT